MRKNISSLPIEGNVDGTTGLSPWRYVFLLLLVLQPVLLPYSVRVSAVCLVALILVWLFLLNINDFLGAIRDKYVILFVTIFAIIPTISLCYSENVNFSFLERRAALFAYPLILFSSKISTKDFKLICFAFIGSCTFASLYTVTCILYNQDDFNTEMSRKYLGVIHVYMGIFLGLAVILSTYFLYTRKRHDIKTALMCGNIIFLLFFMYALGGKMSIIALLLLSVIISIVVIVRRKRWLLGILVVLIPIATFIITINVIDVSKSRFAFMINPENYFVGDNAWNSVAVRVTVYKCAFDVAKENSILFGTGLGDVQNDLNKCFQSNRFISVVGMNAHNQYVQTFLATGVIGVVSLFLFVLVSFRKAVRDRNALYLSFLFLFLFCCLTESILERQQGIIFFSFFNSLLMLSHKWRES